MTSQLNINFFGPEWESLKQWLLTVRERKIGLLLSAKEWDKCNEIRGSISFIDEILAQEKAALKGR